MTTPAPDTRAQTRREIRAARRALSRRERLDRSHDLCVTFARSGILNTRPARVAAFWPNDGEVDLSPLFPRLWQAGLQVYLPVVAGPRLWFANYTPLTPTAENRFGIPEPRGRNRGRVPTWALDLVLMPLVAFDDRGNRIGMGGGFYDRTFAFMARRQRFTRPLLVGTAFEFQRREHIDAQGWDVPLDAVVTDRQWRWCDARSSRPGRSYSDSPRDTQGNPPR